MSKIDYFMHVFERIFFLLFELKLQVVQQCLEYCIVVSTAERRNSINTEYLAQRGSMFIKAICFLLC